MQPKLSLVAGVGRNLAIGKDNQLLWKLPEDMKFIKELTMHHAVVMGSKTYFSIPEKFRPLSNRLNIVLSRQPHANSDQLAWADNLQDALNHATHYASERRQEQFFVFGGGEIYRQCLPQADRLYLTHVDADYDADAFFPDTYQAMTWDTTILAEHAATATQPPFKIVRYDRV